MKQSNSCLNNQWVYVTAVPMDDQTIIGDSSSVL